MKTGTFDACEECGAEAMLYWKSDLPDGGDEREHLHCDVCYRRLFPDTPSPKVTAKETLRETSVRERAQALSDFINRNRESIQGGYGGNSQVDLIETALRRQEREALERATNQDHTGAKLRLQLAIAVEALTVASEALDNIDDCEPPSLIGDTGP